MKPRALTEDEVIQLAEAVESQLRTYLTMRIALNHTANANRRSKLTANAMLPQRFQSLYAKITLLRVLDDDAVRRSALMKADADLVALMRVMDNAGIELPAIEDMIRSVHDASTVRHSSGESEVSVRSFDATALGGHAPAARSDPAAGTTGPGVRRTPAGWLVALEPPDPEANSLPGPATPTPR